MVIVNPFTPSTIGELVNQPHVPSFDSFLDDLDLLVQTVRKLRVTSEFGAAVITITGLRIGRPCHRVWNGKSVETLPVYPSHCRQQAKTYQSDLFCDVSISVEGNDALEIDDLKISTVPMMVGCKLCRLTGLTPQELARRDEDVWQHFGYFIINGNEKLVRLLIGNRCHYPIAISRTTWLKKGHFFTDKAVVLRSCDNLNKTKAVYLHFLSNGNVMVRSIVKRREVMIPLIVWLIAFGCEPGDPFQIIDAVPNEDRRWVRQCVESWEETEKKDQMIKEDAQRIILETMIPILDPRHIYYDHDDNLFEQIVQDVFLIHCSSFRERMSLLLFLTSKLFLFVMGHVQEDNGDALSNHEIMRPGDLFRNTFREGIENWKGEIANRLLRMRTKEAWRTALEVDALKRTLQASCRIGLSMESLLATGNLPGGVALEIQQTSGLVIAAERINYIRFISALRSVHRGSFFQEQKGSSLKVRKLLPESFGFICPVHTPDGVPCGLLNHLSQTCLIAEGISDTLKSRVYEIVQQTGSITDRVRPPFFQFPVLVDGKLVGYTSKENCVTIEAAIKELKNDFTFFTAGLASIECVFVSPEHTLYNGLFVWTTACRLMRPVLKRDGENDRIELIGTFEQLFIQMGLDKHSKYRETKSTAFLSLAAALTPFSDFNQSPRNVYQCQMLKQTMCIASLAPRFDTKAYHLNNLQKPLVATEANRMPELETLQSGTNAVIAILSYTGYDMEDACILSKSAVERGEFGGYITTTKTIDLNKQDLIFGADEGREDHIGEDGLPCVGSILKDGMAFYWTRKDDDKDDEEKGSRLHEYFKCFYHGEDAFVDSVLICPRGKREKGLRFARIRLRHSRNPEIGDKFSSRHGQKGVVSLQMSQENLPFSESGIVPDLIINPHSFPSRMTIGMLIECLAGKAGMLDGESIDSTPFTQYSSKSIEEVLVELGLSRHGTELFYSGITGLPLEFEIFSGVVYYQRLRHMISDKYQVRDFGRRDNFGQPVKGRKAGGGIRFGEMERDALIAHGSAGLLQDRLLLSSDQCSGYICPKCGFLFEDHCACGTKPKRIVLPRILSFLIAELKSVHIETVLPLGDG